MSSKRRGHSYKDPIYDKIEARLERKYKLPKGGMRAIRVKGERSNADQVSPVGASTVYQIMPKTRKLFKKAYGVDAFSSIEAAAEVAALHLRDDLKKTGSWTEAVRRYIGGPNTRYHGKQVAAYVKRVTGEGGDPGRFVQSAGDNGAVRLAPKIETLSVDDILNTAPGDLGPTRKPIGRNRAPKGPSVKDQVTQTITGGKGLIAPTQNTNEVDLSGERALEASNKAEEARRQSVSFGDSLEAAFEETVGHQLMRYATSEDFDYDAGFVETYYPQNYKQIESFAETDDEKWKLRSARSQAELISYQTEIDRNPELSPQIDASGLPTTLRLGTAIADPAGWVAAGGAGKALQIGKVGSVALATQGRPAAAIGSSAIEGALAETALMAGLDASGETVDAGDYAVSMLAGLTIGAAIGGYQVGASKDAVLDETLEEMAENAAQEQAQWTARAQGALGETADEAAVAAEVTRQRANEMYAQMEVLLADVPEDMRILVPEESGLLTAEASTLNKVMAEYPGLTTITDDAERALAAEVVARTEVILQNNPIDTKRLNTLLEKIGQESTSLRLLKSDSPVARAVGVLLENPQGGAGRQRTASMSLAQNERVFNQDIRAYNALADGYRKTTGVGRVEDMFKGTARDQFDKRVLFEIEKRQGTAPGRSFDDNTFVREAADMYEVGYQRILTAQKAASTLGSANLPATSRGYIPHRWDPRKLLGLNAEQSKRFRAVLGRELADGNGFDKKFSDELAGRISERVIERARGGHHVPANLYSPEFVDYITEALENLGVDADKVADLTGKFARGGSSQTRKRLRLDVEADLGDDLKLGDLLDTDTVSLFRAQARRVAGEAALAKYGIFGKKGLTELRKTIGNTGASMKDLEAFDQIAAEFLNTPFGTREHKWLDNVRVVTSASRLGGMGFTQFGEFGNALASLGARETMRIISDAPRLAKEVKALAKGKPVENGLLDSLEVYTGQVGADDYNMSRVLDNKERDVDLYNAESQGLVTKVLRAGGHLNSIMSGHRIMMAVQIRGVSEEIVRKALRYTKAGKQSKALDDMGIDSTLRDAIKKDLDNIATFNSKGEPIALNFDKSRLSNHELKTFADAIERGASQIIQRTYVGETGAWAHDGLLKLLFQFRTFSLTAIEKQWGRNRANYGAMRSFAIVMAASSFAIPIHLARTKLKMVGMSDKDAKEYAERNLTPGALGRASLNYAASAGLLGDALDIGGSAIGGWGGESAEEMVSNAGVRGRGQGQLVGDVMAPGVGLLQDVWEGANGDPHKLLKSLPGGNLPYVTPLVNALADIGSDDEE